MVINENVKKKIIPIASGKGGVGKTVIAANLALALANSGKNTVVIDLDLGGSNLHTCLGLKNTKIGIGNYLSNREISFRDIVLTTPYKNLKFIPGDVLVSGVANIRFSQKKRIIANILKLETDYIIIDLGSGSNFNVIDFFLISNSGFVITTSQPTSVINAYGFLKNLAFRFLYRAFTSYKDVSGYLRSILKERKPNSTPTIKRIIKKIYEIDRKAGEKAGRYISVLHPKIIVNLTESPDDLVISEKLRDLVQKNLEINIECMGLIYSDNTLRESVLELTPLMNYDINSLAARAIDRIAQKIIQSDRFPEMPLDLSYYKDTFELAMIEAQNDFEELLASEKPEEHVDIGELLALISNQKKQISELKGTVRMLTMK